MLGQHGRGHVYYSGPAAASEPETRAALRFLDEVDPRFVATIHQPLAAVGRSGKDPDYSRWLGAELRLPVARCAPATGQSCDPTRSRAGASRGTGDRGHDGGVRRTALRSPRRPAEPGSEIRAQRAFRVPGRRRAHYARTRVREHAGGGESGGAPGRADRPRQRERPGGPTGGDGPARSGDVADLATVDVALLDDVERVQFLQAWEKASRWLAAQHAAAVVAVAGTVPPDRDDSGREYVRMALLGQGGNPKASVDTARALHGPLRPAREALAAGRISEAHVKVLAAETAHLDPEPARLVAERVVGQAEGRTPGRFRDRVRRAVIQADPAGALAAAQRATRARRVHTAVLPDAQAELVITGPAVEVQTVWTALDLRAARASACDTRTLDQRRFDALVALCRDADLHTDASRADRGAVAPAAQAPGRAGSGPRQGLRPAVYIHADAATWAGLADEPADLDGYGPIPAGVAREHFTSSTWRAVVTDALTARPLAVSDSTYRPSARTRRLLHLRDRGCQMPGCTAAVWHCDADHNTPHDQGGPTDAGNCGLLCRRHHRLKTFHGWDWARDEDGAVTWTDPHGQRWRRPPDTSPMPPPPGHPPASPETSRAADRLPDDPPF